MANPSKARGTAAETAVIGFIRAHGFPFAERRTMRGAKDWGDVGGTPGLSWEVKACKRMALAEWLDEATLEAANAGVPAGVVVHKRRGTTDPGRWYVTMDLATFCALAGDEPTKGTPS